MEFLIQLKSLFGLPPSTRDFAVILKIRLLITENAAMRDHIEYLEEKLRSNAELEKAGEEADKIYFPNDDPTEVDKDEMHAMVENAKRPK